MSALWRIWLKLSVFAHADVACPLCDKVISHEEIRWLWPGLRWCPNCKTFVYAYVKRNYRRPCIGCLIDKIRKLVRRLRRDEV